MNLAIIPILLPFYGVKTYGVSTGKQALELLKTLNPTIVLLGLDLKDMDSIDFLQHMRAIPGQANTRVIGMWRYYSLIEHQRVIAAGCSEYVCQAAPLNTLLAKSRKLNLL